MRGKAKRALVCLILTALLVGIAALFSGCFSLAGLNGLGNKKPVERTENDINLVFDAEERTFSWDPIKGAYRYAMYVQAANSDFSLFVNFHIFEEDELEDRLSFYVGSDLKENEKEFLDGCYVLLEAYGENYDEKDKICAYRIFGDFLSVSNDSLAVENGKLVWDAVEGADSYIVRLNGNVKYAATNEFDLSEYNVSDYSFTVDVNPVGGEGLWLSAPTDEVRAVCVPAPKDIGYSGSVLHWRSGESNHFYYKETDVEYVITYRDGDETKEIVQSQTTYDYKPKTADFSCSVRARLKADVELMGIASAAVEYTPIYHGTVENFVYNEESRIFTWNLNAKGYDLYLDGEPLGHFTENSLRANQFWTYDGIKELRISPSVEEGYCTDFALPVRFVEEVQVELSQSSANGVLATARDFKGASSCLVEYSSAFEQAGVQEYTVENDQISVVCNIGDGKTEASGSLSFTPVFTDGILTVERGSYAHVVHHGETEVLATGYESNTPYVMFETNHTVEVDFNGEITQVTTAGNYSLANMYAIPTSALGDKNFDKSITLRIRTLRGSGAKLQLPSEWYTIEVRRLAAPQDFRVENGVARWEYKGAWDFGGYEFDFDGTASRTESEQKEIVLDRIGGYWLQVKTLADNAAAPQTGIWYLDSENCDGRMVRKLYYPTNIEHDDYGIQWSGSDDGSEYEVRLTAADGVAYEKTVLTAESTLHCAEYLKDYHTLNVSIIEKGDRSSTFDSEPAKITITLNPNLTYSMYNTDDYDGELSQISWEYFDDTVTYDYYVKDPNGNTLDSGKGVSKGQTRLFYAPEAVGASVLGINVPAAKFYKDGLPVYLLKTGDDEYDYWEQEIWKMYAVATLAEDGTLAVESFPKITQDTIYTTVYLRNKQAYASSNTGKWTIKGADFSGVTLGNGKIEVDISISRTNSAKYLMFYNPDKEAVYDCIVKTAAVPTLGVDDYVAGEIHYAVSNGVTRTNTVLPTVGLIAHSELTQGCTYTYKHYDSSGVLQDTVTSAENTCAFRADVYDAYTVQLNANVFVETNGEWCFYKSSEESELFEIDAWTDFYTKNFIWENGVLTIGKTYHDEGEIAQIIIGDASPVDIPATSAGGNYVTYTYDTGLAAGETVVVMLWNQGDRTNYPDRLPSYKCYFTLTVE